MIKFLVKKFVKNYEKTDDKKVRENYSVLGGVLGGICNIFLFAVKLFIGMAMKSIAIMSDAFNNLSDMGSCCVAVIGAKMSNRKPDREHPYGHGRLEYISSLIVAFLIMLVGFELFKSSFDKILHPEEIVFSLPMTIILALSLLVKLWMYFAYSYIGKTINSTVMKATARDSVNDVISTSAVILATIIGYFLPFSIDGYIGVVVAVYIMYGGFNLTKETIDLLLGTPPSEELINSISDEVMKAEEICGIHDLIVHDYGPGRTFASVHAEVPENSDIVHVHEIIDEIEREVSDKLGISLVIHMDPVADKDEFVLGLKKLVLDTATGIDKSCAIHDFRITNGDKNINAIFDIVIRDKYDEDERRKVVEELKKRVAEEDPRLNLVITIDEVYS
ncbi:MAG: cation diffusion facilitator family transporter [Oscillospiraceae bacterium]